MKLWTTVFAAIGFLGMTLAASANAEDTALSDAGSRVRTTINEIKAVVAAGKSQPADVVHKKVEDVVRPVFDFDEMARSCLGENWNTASPAEQKEFVELFSSMLANTYIDRIIKGIDQAEIKYLSDQIKGGDRAILKTKIISSEEEVSVDYRLRNAAGGWRIYDVVIENVGLVNNYRTDFSAVIRKDGMSGLLAKLRQKKAGKAKDKE